MENTMKMKLTTPASYGSLALLLLGCALAEAVPLDSDDGGRTWTTPAKDRGFKIDDSVYVYAIGCEMPDGSIYVVYYDPRGNQTKTAVRGIRLRIRKDRQGIDILPMD